MSYPDQNDEEAKASLLPSLTLLPDGVSRINLEYLRSKVWKEASEFRVSAESIVLGMQANMFNIVLKNPSKRELTIICKRIYPKELPAKQNLDVWKDFIESVRKEILFYRELMAQDEAIRFLFPKVYDTLINYPNPEINEDPMEVNSLILMSDVSNEYHQRPDMGETDAKLIMKNIAQFHAYFWNNIPSSLDRGSFWTLKRRLITGEVQDAYNIWNGILDRFPDIEESLKGEDVRKLGPLLCSKAEELDSFAERGAVTRIHGDLKGWNLFFSKDHALFIDMQWTGKGHPLQDVAYVLTTTLESGILDQMDDFVDYYVNELRLLLGPKVDYAVLRSQFDYIWLDYVRVIVTGLWKKLSHESIEANKCKIGPSMINQSINHVLFIIKRLHRLISKEKLLDNIPTTDFSIII